MGQGGNVWEWNETAYDGTNNTAGESREVRGGAWFSYYGVFDASYRTGNNPSVEDYSLGFRVASVPEPSTGLLVVLGLSGLLLKRRKTGTL
jgi:formylglycine-generating enzyme required for sulfatase activity